MSTPVNASPSDHPSLRRLLDMSRAFPEADREPFGEHTRIVVRGKTFAWFTNNHHGDGVVGVLVKSGQERADAMVAAGPSRFYRPAYLGGKGWVGIRLDRIDVDWDEVRELVAESYLLIAPKRLAAQVR